MQQEYDDTHVDDNDIDDTIRERLAETDHLVIGGPPTDSRATLCIYADELDPVFVTQMVGCRPTRAGRKGVRYFDRPTRPPAPTGHWLLKAPEDLSFIDKIDFLLDATTASEETWCTLAESHAMVLSTAVFMHAWNEDFQLSNDTLARISQRKWSFSVDMYGAEGDEVLDAFLRHPPPAGSSNG